MISKLLIFIVDFVKLLLYYISGLLFLTTIYILFIKQLVGQDVLIQITEYSFPYFSGITALILGTVLIWYSLRLKTYLTKIELTNQWLMSIHKRHFPRVISLNITVFIEIAFFHLFEFVNFFENNSQIDKETGEIRNLLITIGYFLISNFILFIVYRLLQRIQIYRIHFTLLCTTYFIILIFASYYIEILKIYNLKFLITILLLKGFQVILLCFFIIRHNVLVKNQRFLLPLTIPKNEYATARIFLGIFFVLVLWVVALLTSRNYVATYSGSFSIAIISFTLLIVLISLTNFIKTKYSIPLYLLLVISGIVFQFSNERYKVDLTSESTNVFEKRDSISAYLYKWLNKRASVINSYSNLHNGEKFPVYLIVSEGGGSRSGYWTSSVLSALQDADYKDNLKFTEHVLSISGASGGSQGNATFYSCLYLDELKHQKLDSNYKYECRNFSRSDFLSALLSKYLVNDIYSHIFPVFKKDRAVALAESYEYIYGEKNNQAVSKVFSKKLSDLYDYSGKLPFFFISTTRLEDGIPAVISNVKLDSNNYCIDLLSMLNDRNIKLSTAVAMSSRFPFLLPAGKIDNFHYVDGGYFDNYGSMATMILYKKIIEIFNGSIDTSTHEGYINSFKDKIEFKLVIVTNSSPNSKYHKMTPVENDFASPLNSILSVRSSSTQHLLNQLKAMVWARYKNNSIIEIKINKDIPMNLVISDFYLAQMDTQLNRQVIGNKELSRKLKFNF